MNKQTGQRAAELRAAFDEGFAALPNMEGQKRRDLLAVTLANGSYALELADIAGIYIDKKITRIPSQSVGLLGIAGFRGTILPVYDLAVLLGLPPLENPKWIAVAANAGVAIAFETYDGHLRVSQEDAAANESAEGVRRHVRYLLRTPDGLRAIINLSSALQKVTGTEL
jgi:chemotaxis signal transduction protein